MPIQKPTLRGERVVLVPIGPEHAEALLAATEHPEGRRLTGTHAVFTLPQVRAFCEGLATRDDRIDLAITDAGTGVFLGEVVLNEIDTTNRKASFRIALAHPTSFGRGYGTEAARLLLAHGFDALELHRIELEVYTFNPRAIRVYEKLGFQHEGVRRQVLLWDGAFHDAIQMALLEGELVR